MADARGKPQQSVVYDDSISDVEVCLFWTSLVLTVIAVLGLVCVIFVIVVEKRATVVTDIVIACFTYVAVAAACVLATLVCATIKSRKIDMHGVCIQRSTFNGQFIMLFTAVSLALMAYFEALVHFVHAYPVVSPMNVASFFMLPTVAIALVMMQVVFS